MAYSVPNHRAFTKRLSYVCHVYGLERARQIWSETGIKWKDSENTEHASEVYALSCSSDLIARPLLRNTKQFDDNL